MFIHNDKKWMQKVIELALKGGCTVRPNPLVGAIIVKNNRVIGSGYHKQCGGPHAEIAALKQAGRHARGSTMYVSLEPCNHHGKTPPCTESVISSGIKRVVVAMKDPNPLVAGKGIKKLRKSGILVDIGLLKDSAEEINRVYIKNISKNEPYVIVKMAQTLDGKTASQTGDSKWISCEKSRDLVHAWRTDTDAVMVGANTIIQDDPVLDSHGKGRNPLRIIIDPDNKIDKSYRIYKSGKKPIIISCGKSLVTVERKGGRVDLKKLIKEIYNIGIYKLLIEGGGTLVSYALDDGIVDEIRFFIAPKIIGGRYSLTSVEGKGIDNIKKAIKVKDWSFEHVGDDVLVRGFI